jgi:peptide deformylase
VSEDVKNIDGKLVNLLKSTIFTMKQAKGIGLAANQVGITRRFFAIDLSHFDVVKSPIAIVNPKIVEVSSTTVVGEEGCLSFPGLYQDVERPEKAIITGLDFNGNEITLEGKGLVARVLLHEIDHLNGRLFIDRIPKLKLGLIKGKLKKIKAGERV